MTAKLRLVLALSVVGTVLGTVLYLSLRQPDTRAYATFDPAFEGLITAYTSGEISRQAPWQVRFADEMVSTEQAGQPLDHSPFRIEPKVEGQATWRDPRTLVFTPAAPLPSGETYHVELDLKALDRSLPSALQRFRFLVATRPQDMKVELTRLRMLSEDYQQVQGVVRTLDYASTEQVEQTLAAELAGEPLRVKWTHDVDRNEHRFTIDSLRRGDDDRSLKLRWKGQTIDADADGEQQVMIPAKMTFRHLHTYAYAEPEQYVVVEFSAPLAKNQDLSGLIDLAQTDEKFLIEDNRVKVYPTQQMAGPVQLKVTPGIRTEAGDKLRLAHAEEVVFSEIKPELRLIGKGSIMPRSGSMPLVFEAIGLKAIDVRVIKIFENNIPQFFQTNQLDEHQQLKRVGQPVVQKRIDLDANRELDLNQWNRHSLDLASLIEADPGAIYEVALGFRPAYAFYTCAEGEMPKDVNMLDLGEDWFVYTDHAEQSYWDYWSYDYDDRENPCRRAYYNQERMVRRNVLASDLGIVAKQGEAGAFFAVTNLQTTQPMRGVELEVYDFQQQLITTATTGQDGTVRAKVERPPFLLVAKQGQQRGYLRLDDGSALSMSRFDTRGQTYYQGVQGFLYGERGVWRPGDTLHLTFILEDEQNALPPQHPVNFELIDPRGQVVERRARTEGTGGFYPFPVATAPDAPTGTYTAKVQVGGATFTETFKVETIIPNRMKLGLDFGRKYLSPQTKDATGTLSARWLHGAIAQTLKADVRVSLSPVSTRFAKYQDFHFNDPVRDFDAEEQTLFDGRLNGQGEAQVQAKISVNQEAPGQLQANFVAKVFEPGGAFSVDRFSLPYHPYQTYVGVKAPKGDAARNMLLTDTDHEVKIATVDPEGNPRSSSVVVTLYKLDWKWWWDQSEDNIGMYRGKVRAKEIETQTVSTSGGMGTYVMNVKYPQWGRFLIRAVDDDGHATGQIVYIDWPGWAGRSTDRERDGAQMLSFTADKEQYDVGEDITLNLPTGAAGRALVSVESGPQVLAAYWVDAKKGQTQFSFPATAAMTPNVYVHVTLLQPHAQTANDLPIRMYGVIPLRVEDPRTHLQPRVALPETIQPNSPYQVQVSEATGQPMTYTLAVVDEGLLGLTRYQTPDPWQTFYQRIGLDVKTWDVYDHVLGAYGGEVKSMLSIGGGAGDQGPKGKKPDRFKPVVECLGPFELKPGQTATHALRMPNYLGEVRAMVVAGHPETGAYGAAQQSAKVKQPLMVLGTLPRVLGPGERAQVPVTVFALENDISVVNLEIEVGKKLLVEGKPRQVLRFEEPGEKMAYFEVGVLSSLGKTPIKITATSNGQVSVYETEIEIRTPNPRVTDVLATSLEGRQSWNVSYQPVGLSGTNAATLELSSIPPLNLGQRLDYLIRYPYGCIEQTTSGAFPQVYLSQLMELGQSRKGEIDQNIRGGINRLKRFQMANGGLAYWPGQPEADEWGTNYAGHFLLEAEQIGYTLPATLRQNWLKYQRDQARDYSARQGTNRQDELNQAYRLYLLAMAGEAEIGAMNRFRQRNDPDNVAQWYLAAAYHLAGRSEVGQRLSSGLSTQVQAYTELGGTYGSTLRDQAIILMCRSVMGQRDQTSDLVKRLSDGLASDQWYSTQTTAYSLVAMAKYVGEGGVSADMAFAYRLDGGKWTEVESATPLWQLAWEDVRAGKLEVKNKGNGMVFPRLILDGIPMQGDTSRASNGLTIATRYTTLNGDRLDVSQLAQGTDFIAKVTVKNTGNRDYEELALDQMFPSGWEILNTRLDNLNLGGATPTYKDIRDDRVYQFFDLKRGERKTFHVMLNAAYLGQYYLPTVEAQAMYDRSINARVGGRWVKVLEPGTGG